jgi:ATP adenylyltransferase
LDYLWSPWRYKYLIGTEKPAGCIFCAMAATPERDRETLVVFRGQHNFIVLNRFPYTSGHLMVVPYFHSANLAGIASAAASELMDLVRRSETTLQTVYKPDGLNLGMNIGESAGAGIAGHIHMHVLPRWFGDANFMTTVGETRILPEELDVTWVRLREAFSPETTDLNL